MGRPWKGDEPVECMGDGEVQMVAFTVAPPHVGRDCDEQRERRAEAWAERAKVKKQEQAAAEPEEEEVRSDLLLLLTSLLFLSSGIVLPIQARYKRE